MSRSYRLCSKRYWPVLGIALLSGIITSALDQIIGLPTAGVAAGAAVAGVPALSAIMIAAASLVSEIFIAPITAIIATLLYFDLRIRQEGFDLQVLARDLQAPSPAPAAGPVG